MSDIKDIKDITVELVKPDESEIKDIVPAAPREIKRRRSKKKPFIRVTGQGSNARTALVCQLLSQGMTRTHIMEHPEIMKWNLSSRMVDEYIRKAKRVLNEMNEATIAEARALIQTGLWKQYRNADAMGKVSDAISALNAIAKIKGLDQSHMLHTVETRELKNLSDDELEAAYINITDHEDKKNT